MVSILPPEEIKSAKAWFHDIFVWGGLLKDLSRTLPLSRYRYMYGESPDNTKREDYRKYAQIICQAITGREVGVKQFQKYDDALEKLSWCAFNPDVLSNNVFGYTKKSPETLAKYIAWFCQQNKWYWDNRKLSTYEEEEIKTNSVLGKVLWDNYLFYARNNEPEEEKPVEEKPTPADDGIAAAQADAQAAQAAQDPAQPTADPTPAPASNQAPAANPAPAAQPDPNGKPLSPWKARGPLASVAVDIKGPKEFLSGEAGYIFSINGIDANGKALEDCAYIRPVEEKNQNKFMAGNTNMLLFGKAKGNGYCQIFFNSVAEAQDFLNNKNIDWDAFIKGNIASIGITKARPQKSGYFRIGTEYGDVYISAPKINEMLEEDLTQEKEEIPGIEVNFNDFAENYIK